jgi:deoxyribodipyrimidine photo-lyase
MSSVIVWFRQDLRLSDNPALYYAAKTAAKSADQLLLVYIYSPQEHAQWPPGAASRWWLHHSLKALQAQVEKLGGKLVIRQGDSQNVLLELIRHSGAQAVFSNYLYEPALAARDQEISKVLHNLGVDFHRYHGSVLMAPDTLQTGSGTPFKVFTPYWKKHQQRYSPQTPLNAPRHLKHSHNRLASVSIDRLPLLPNIHWYQGLQQHWRPGEQQAFKTLQRFAQSALVGYKERRDIPCEPYTSSLSPYLHFGEISPRQIYWQIQQQQGTAKQTQYASAETFIKELIWREFAYYVLHHFPHTTDQPLDRRFRNFPYLKSNHKLLRAWQTGTTGYPLVDAGMRQLWHCGWMHNRVRMIVASFLTKNGLMSWKQGAQWFWDTLVDADLASNSFNWQWCAGCGADAAPYFRIFNPVTQSQKFDPHGDYIKTWLPELRGLPDKYIHEPWKAPDAVQTHSKVIIGKHYPSPVIDLQPSRQRALDSYRQFVKSPTNK